MHSTVANGLYFIKQKLFVITTFTFCLLAIVFLSTVKAQVSGSRSLILSDSYSEYFLSPYLKTFYDHDKGITIDQIISSENPVKLRTIDNTGSIISLGSEGFPTWYKVSILNRSDSRNWKLDFGDSFKGRFGLFEDIKSYVYNSEEEQFQENKHIDGNVIHINLSSNSKSEIYIQITASRGVPTTFPLRLVKADTGYSPAHNKGLLIAATLMIGMAFFFAAIAITRSDYQYLFFTIYYLTLTTLLLVQNFLFVTQIPIFGALIIPFLLLVSCISGMMVARLFWDIEGRSQLTSLGFYGFLLLCLGIFFTAVFIDAESAFVRTVMLFGPSLFIITLIPLISISQSNQGHAETTPFMFGWFIVLFGTCITILSLSGIMQPVSTAINAYWYTLIPQAIFFIIAAKIKVATEIFQAPQSKVLEINETDAVARLRQSKENTEQERLLKVIEQERKVLGELRKSEARRTEEMRLAKDDADVANKAKSAFLAVVSHEIRTPMTGIMGMVRLLLNSNLTKEQKEFAQTIQDSSDAMLALLNDILDFEKIEQGKMSFENISFDAHRLIRGVTQLMNGHAAQKNIELKTNIGDTLPKYVKGDPTRLRQVLLNLTGNAVKFTEKGHVTITAELMGKNEETGEHEIYFGVTDSGIGISEKAQKDLFSPFAQADSSISRKFGGTGLGLAISKGLVQGMGSNININSNEGEGSTFFFTLKMAAGQSAEALNTKTKENNTTAKEMNILVVDDNAINRRVIEGFLEKLPYKLTMASSAEEALENTAQNVYDLILMDIELPGMKGHEAAIEMRCSGETRIRKTPIIALTGNVMPEDEERYYKAGMNDVIAKPIDADVMIEKIAQASQGIFKNPEMKTHLKPKPIDDEQKQKRVPLHGYVPKPRTDIPAQNKPNTNQEEIKKTETVLEVTNNENPAVKTETLDMLKGHLDKNALEEMLNDVIEKTDDIIAAMKEAINEDDTEKLSAKGHEMRGMTGNFGLLELSHQAGEIERKAKTDAVIILTGLVDPLPDMKKRAKEALDQWLDDNFK